MKARRRKIRHKKPYVAGLDQVRITRGPAGADIEYAEENVGGVQLVMSPAEQAALTDEQILEIHNQCIEAQQASRNSYDWVAVEVPPGTPQLKRDRTTGHILPRGDVLRCHITDGCEDEEDPVAIYIDDEEYTLREFGQMLRLYAGWGMRVVFVPEDSVHEEPAIEVRKSKRGR
ncbi:MAG TPA: hypothetical protein VGM51_17550 [Armatimonadota bacterium]|jgi:hypothetical protein